MTMMRFIKFINKVLGTTKKRTVRKKRKCNCGASIIDYSMMSASLPSTPRNLKYKRDKCICQIKKGDTLQVYVFVKVGDATVTNVKKLDLSTFTDKDAQLDGFDTLFDFETGLAEMHDDFYSEEFHIIDFEPDWDPKVLGKKISIMGAGTRTTDPDMVHVRMSVKDYAIFRKQHTIERAYARGDITIGKSVVKSRQDGSMRIIDEIDIHEFSIKEEE